MIGKGNTAEVFEYGVDKVCKLFFEGYPLKYIELEYNNAKELYRLKLNVPKTYKIVSMNNRNGIVYERINGQTLSSLMYENKENYDELLDMFVQVHCELLKHHSKEVLSYKDFLTASVTRKSPQNHPLLNEISDLPDGDCLLHGDFHPNNILVKCDGKPVIIDFMNVCYGPSLYDIARTFFLIKQIDEHTAKNYLCKMNILEKDILRYLKIIEKCRMYEG